MSVVKAKARALLSKHLILNSYMNSLFGVKSFEEHKELIHPHNGPSVPDGFDAEGRSYIFYYLKSRSSSIKIPLDKLETYDSNIRGYVQRLNKHRERPIVLKYFQYLAVLYTEVYLDKFFSDPTGFLAELNSYAVSIEDNEIFFSRRDLRKLAFWMATGSGKTFLIHINYMQFMRYNQGVHKIDFDNILLITPSEMLSNQHVEDMHLSGVPCGLFHDLNRGYFSDCLGGDVVKVLDIHKFTEEKSGSGVTIDIEEFGNNNLVFVDEGHKGSGGVKWRRFREFVAQKGFTFEYSATFGQAIAANKKNSGGLLEEYGKAILFDYSYRYFYNDGYGKDYRILNLKKSVYDESKDVLLCANALTFYEQLLLFEDFPKLVDEYNIEPPLWIFVGSKVKGKKEDSDILEIVKFLDKFLRNKDNWSVETIGRILAGNSNLLDGQNRDLFSPSYPERKLQYLRDQGLDAEYVYDDILRHVFRVSGPCNLRLINLKGIEGEIGLRGSGHEEFFGVINIGDVSSFLKLTEKNGFERFEHELSRSLFDDIEDPNSKVNVLIGAKKFIEGWNSWRVSNMGLLNIGKKEGSQIIQLFGRGVRLRGKDFSLKRSGALEGGSHRYLRALETLNIFGIEANYMDQFREYLQEEGIEDENMLEISLDIEVNEEFLGKGLVLPRIDISRFCEEEFFRVTGDENTTVSVDLNLRTEELTSLDAEGIRAERGNPPRRISNETLAMLDWDSIYFQLLEYKRERGWSNMVFSKEVLRRILNRDSYTLLCPSHFAIPRVFEDLCFVEYSVVSILKKYLRELYNRHRRVWGQRNVEIAELSRSDANLDFDKFSLKVKESEQFVFAEIKQSVEDKLDEIRGGNFSSNYIKNVYFDRHIYQPLLADSDQVLISPSGLNEGEQLFVMHLKQFILDNSSLFKGKEVFLLRNLPRHGVGFYDAGQFFPDFIIWVKSDKCQNLIFVDPHSMTHAFLGLEDEKIKLARSIKDIERAIQKKPGFENIFLDSFIVSVSYYRDVKGIFNNKPRITLEENHILFQKDDSEYIHKIFYDVS